MRKSTSFFTDCGQAPALATMLPLPSAKQSDFLYWALAVVFGAAAGYTHVSLRDSSLSVLMVTGATMFLAYIRPERIWRWIIVLGFSLPTATLAAQLSRYRPSLGMTVGSFAGLAFSIVAAFGGRVLRRVVDELFPAKNSPPSRPPQ